jgi:hypothetical protein
MIRPSHSALRGSRTGSALLESAMVRWFRWPSMPRRVVAGLSRLIIVLTIVVGVGAIVYTTSTSALWRLADCPMVLSFDDGQLSAQGS